MSRTIRPTAPVAVTPCFVSQTTSLAVLGIDPMRYLDHLLPLCRDHIVRVGKLRLLPLHIAVDALRSLADSPEVDIAPDGPSQPETADSVLEALGLERT